MSVTHTDPPETKPVPAGFWMTILGGLVAVLAPLAGLLGGSMSGGSAADNSARLVVWLAAGLVIGGLGVLCAFIGGMRWFRAAHE
ncbi:MAG: hypothetical protein L0H25_07735 [Micrococcales bacterium]|nr:hypothetical protein [Micrococcales bacterium]